MRQSSSLCSSATLYLEGETLLITAKQPWHTEFAYNNVYDCFRKYVGEPQNDDATAFDVQLLQCATEEALLDLDFAARLVTWVEGVRTDLATAASSADLKTTAVATIASIGPWIEQLQAVVTVPKGEHVAPERIARFTITPPERVRLLGRTFDNAHAAAFHVLPGLLDLWNMLQEVAPHDDPSRSVIRELFLEGLRQMESMPFAELLLQVRREHLWARDQRSARAQFNAAISADATRPPQWSSWHPKKTLKHFFLGSNGKTPRLIKYMDSRNVRFEVDGRQAVKVDLNTLDAATKERFLGELEPQLATSRANSSHLRPK